MVFTTVVNVVAVVVVEAVVDVDKGGVISIPGSVIDAIAGPVAVITSFSAAAFSICLPSTITRIERRILSW